MKININQNEKRIITNEDLYNLILSQNDVIADNKTELLNVIAGNRTELHNMIVDNKTGLHNVIVDNKTELQNMMIDSKTELHNMMIDGKTELHNMIVDSFDRFFNVVDEANRELKLEIKKEISELRTDMNQRFLIVDKRLLSIENNMVSKHEFYPLVKRVELLEARL